MQLTFKGEKLKNSSHILKVLEEAETEFEKANSELTIHGIQSYLKKNADKELVADLHISIKMDLYQDNIPDPKEVVKKVTNSIAASMNLDESDDGYNREFSFGEQNKYAIIFMPGTRLYGNKLSPDDEININFAIKQDENGRISLHPAAQEVFQALMKDLPETIKRAMESSQKIIEPEQKDIENGSGNTPSLQIIKKIDLPAKKTPKEKPPPVEKVKKNILSPEEASAQLREVKNNLKEVFHIINVNADGVSNQGRAQMQSMSQEIKYIPGSKGHFYKIKNFEQISDESKSTKKFKELDIILAKNLNLPNNEKGWHIECQFRDIGFGEDKKALDLCVSEELAEALIQRMKELKSKHRINGSLFFVNRLSEHSFTKEFMEAFDAGPDKQAGMQRGGR